jgi:hypothetical protein
MESVNTHGGSLATPRLVPVASTNCYRTFCIGVTHQPHKEPDGPVGPVGLVPPMEPDGPVGSVSTVNPVWLVSPVCPVNHLPLGNYLLSS